VREFCRCILVPGVAAIGEREEDWGIEACRWGWLGGVGVGEGLFRSWLACS